jgi:uncharacterized protein CbrC (UPF0167 family)
LQTVPGPRGGASLVIWLETAGLAPIGQDEKVPDELPRFRYHPDPLSTGSIVKSPALCVSCRKARRFIYTGPVYAADDLAEKLCPWCIADGTAAQTWSASFTDVGADVPDGVPTTVLDEIEHRTPSYLAWQQDHWMYHCADGCEFLGRAGHKQLAAMPAGAVAAVAASVADYGWDEDETDAFVKDLDADAVPTAYLFRCLHCGAYSAYCDAD